LITLFSYETIIKKGDMIRKLKEKRGHDKKEGKMGSWDERKGKEGKE